MPGSEDELAQNSWLAAVPAIDSILFEMPRSAFAGSDAKLGISFSHLSDVAGHA